MNIQERSPLHSMLDSLFGRRRLIAIGLVSLALAACGGGSVTGPDASAGGSTPSTGEGGGSTEPATALDCVRQAYPCSFDKVALPIVERSLVLSEEVARQLGDGVEIGQVAASLAARSDVVEVTVDGPVLGFRLAGGRPMIVDVTGEQEMVASATVAGASDAAPDSAPAPGKVAAGSLQQARAAHNGRAVRSALTTTTVGGSKTQRRALVLSPFRYEADFGNSGEWIANALNGVRGYTGNVTYLATTDESDPKVTVDVLTQLRQYDVIHIDTHGGTLCKGKDVAEPKTLTKGKDKKKCEDGVTDFLVQRFHGTAQDLKSIAHPGVVHYRGRLHQSIAVTADFFHHYYPEGLSDQLFILGACNTFRTDMADAVAGDRGVYVSWDGYTEYGLVKNTGLALLDSLGLGLTVGESFARLPSFSPENPDAQGNLRRTARRAGGDLRIRDLITVRDNLTGKLVTDASGIEVKEVPGDGQNDHLDLEFTVDGITPERLGNFYVNLVVDDKIIGHLNLQQSGVHLGDFSYRVSTVVPLPFDAQQGQSLKMDFWIPLPDLGEHHFLAAPKVNERIAPSVGSEWSLSSQSTLSGVDDLTVKTASVVFEIEPDDDPQGRYHYFRVKSGSVRIQREYEDARRCRFIIDHTIDIPAGAANNYLRIDAGSQNMLLKGFGSVPSQTVQATGSCGDTVSVSVGGVYFVADETPVSGGALQGGYNDGAARPTIIQWSLSKTK